MRDFFKRDITLYVVAIFIGLLLLSVFLTYNRPLTYTMTVSDSPVINQPVTVDFEVEKNMAHYSPTSFNVELTHKYNSNDTYSFDLEPYQPGRYEFIFTPGYSGDYLVTLTLKFEGTTQYFSETINIEQ